MLEPVMQVLQSQRIILASGSPRRVEILKAMGLKFDICPSLYGENLDPSKYKCHSEYVLDCASNKVQEVADRLFAEGNKSDIIIGADTVVSMNGKLYGKPEDEEAAVEMLKQLGGHTHTVFTGVVVHTCTKIVKFSESTKVFMAPISEEIIKAYVKTGEPLDKAGGYGIQGLGGSLIEKIEGDYFNVMGLPLHSLCKHLVEIYKNTQLYN